MSKINLDIVCDGYKFILTANRSSITVLVCMSLSRICTVVVMFHCCILPYLNMRLICKAWQLRQSQQSTIFYWKGTNENNI